VKKRSFIIFIASFIFCNTLLFAQNKPTQYIWSHTTTDQSKNAKLDTSQGYATTAPVINIPKSNITDAKKYKTLKNIPNAGIDDEVAAVFLCITGEENSFNSEDRWTCSLQLEAAFANNFLNSTQKKNIVEKLTYKLTDNDVGSAWAAIMLSVIAQYEPLESNLQSKIKEIFNSVNNSEYSLATRQGIAEGLGLLGSSQTGKIIKALKELSTKYNTLDTLKRLGVENIDRNISKEKAETEAVANSLFKALAFIWTRENDTQAKNTLLSYMRYGGLSSSYSSMKEYPFNFAIYATFVAGEYSFRESYEFLEALSTWQNRRYQGIWAIEIEVSQNAWKTLPEYIRKAKGIKYPEIGTKSKVATWTLWSVLAIRDAFAGYLTGELASSSVIARLYGTEVAATQSLLAADIGYLVANRYGTTGAYELGLMMVRQEYASVAVNSEIIKTTNRILSKVKVFTDKFKGSVNKIKILIKRKPTKPNPIPYKLNNEFTDGEPLYYIDDSIYYYEKNSGMFMKKDVPNRRFFRNEITGEMKEDVNYKPETEAYSGISKSSSTDNNTYNNDIFVGKASLENLPSDFSLKGKRILVISEYNKTAGFGDAIVDTTNNGHDLMTLLTNNKYDFVFLDFSSSYNSIKGREFIRIVRDYDTNVPVIADAVDSRVTNNYLWKRGFSGRISNFTQLEKNEKQNVMAVWSKSKNKFYEETIEEAVSENGNIFNPKIFLGEGETVANPLDLLKGKKILIVDDNATASLAAKPFLEKYGVIVETATDEPEFKNLFTKNKYDLVFMDLSFPNTPKLGEELVAYIRNIDTNIPVIANTGNISQKLDPHLWNQWFSGRLENGFGLNGIDKNGIPQEINKIAVWLKAINKKYEQPMVNTSITSTSSKIVEATISEPGNSFDLNTFLGHGVKPSGFSLEGKKVLIVDDNYMKQVISKTYLEEHSAIVEIAVNEDEFLPLITKNKYDFVIMDLEGSSDPRLGEKLATYIRKLDKDVTIIANTATPEKYPDQHLWEVGFNGRFENLFGLNKIDEADMMGVWFKARNKYSQ